MGGHLILGSIITHSEWIFGTFSKGRWDHFQLKKLLQIFASANVEISKGGGQGNFFANLKHYLPKQRQGGQGLFRLFV